MNEPFPRLDEPHPEPPRALWGFKEMGISVVIVLVALFLIFSVIVEPFRAAYGDDAPETLTANAIANLVWNVAIIVTVLWFVRRARGNATDLGLVIPEGSSVLRIAAMAIATFLVMYVLVIIYGVVVDTFGIEFLEPDQQVPDAFYDSDIALGVLGIAIVIGAPITEEIFFRGFLFGGARRYLGPFIAALATGFLFSMAHYNAGLVIPFTLVGAILALSYQRSGTLFVPMGAHFIFNLLSYSILVFVPDARP